MAEKEQLSFILELNDYLESFVRKLIKVRTLLVTISTLFSIIFSLLLAIYFRFEFSFPEKELNSLLNVIVTVIIVKMIFFLCFKLFSGMWRYVSITDMVKIFSANLMASSVLWFVISFWHEEFFVGFARSVLAIDFLICFFVMSGKRVVMRIIRESAARASGSGGLRTIIVGSSQNINNLIQAMGNSMNKRIIIGVMCEDVKIGYTIRGFSVLGVPASAAKCAKKHRAGEILLLPPYSTPKVLRDIMDDLNQREAKCELRMIPSYTDIAEGTISVSNIKKVEIEDLLGRKPVTLDCTEVEQFVKGKNIMVTGAGGSIGSELCHQLAAYSPSKLLLFELSEFNLYEVNRKLKLKYPDLDMVNFIGDVRDKENVLRALKENSIDIVYHTAAYKHVPLVEENPAMAFRTNVLGSSMLATCSEEAGVKRVVIISTDKAVRPTSVMGATKRVAERVILERKESKTEFIVVRFGNVLGSSGSVIPLFKSQIANGGPVTVTSENVVRYFMSIPEAVDLVLQAGTIGNDRDIMVLEMGEQVRIYDMAQKLIELSGFVPNEDIEIKVTGLRPGEKEYEELLTEEETVDRTPFDRICVARKEDTSLSKVDLEQMQKHIDDNDIDSLKSLLREYIPENKFDEAS